MPPRRSIRVAAGQMAAHPIDSADSAWPAIDRLAALAADARADLLVLPECTYPAYWLGSAARCRQPDILPTPAVLDRLSAIAARSRLHLVSGIVEQRGNSLFNAAALFAPDGRLIGTAHKNFLWDCDNRWFTPGDEIRVFDTAIGRIGILICADARAPEVAATLAAKGAELIAMPTAWVNVSKQPGTLYNIQPDFLIESRAREFAVPFICADKSGPEPPLHYVGRSLITNARGAMLARAPVEGESLITAEITPARACPATPAPDQLARLLSRAALPEAPSTATLTLLSIRKGVFHTASARVAHLDAREDPRPIASFVPARMHALDGIQILCARACSFDLATLRTRAAENRIFLMAAGNTESLIIAPDGQIIARGPSDLNATVDLAQADLKQFTPETNIWSQRRPAAYQLFSEPRP